MSIIIQGQGVVKRFGSLTAVDGIDFAIAAGECFGFLGPNGAGKTTTLRLIHCVTPLAAGQLMVDGLDVSREGRRIKSMIGVMPQEDNLDPDLTVRENLLVYARYFDLPGAAARSRAQELMELFQLQDRPGSRIDTLSGGLKRRLLAARALINSPKILILDEPTSGLDPQARHLMWAKLRQLKEAGVTIILSTHYMEEAAHLCDRLAIMHLGKIIAQGRPADLVWQHAQREVLEVRQGPSARRDLRERLAGHAVRVEEADETLFLFCQDGEALRRQLGLSGEGLTLRPSTLEDVFLLLTGRALSD
ncbi:MAG: ATP-binding cassette domain-containing protein [Chloroflexi bacterium]|nr:ATP-binding cassette domain-containing protein [Chloroflexota bacterium]